MPDNDDNLADLLRAPKRPRSESRPATPRRGLSPVELLELPAAERELITWLSRERYATLAAIQTSLGWSGEQTEQTLAALRARHAVHQALVNGQPVFRVVFSGVSGRGRRALPGALLSAIDLDAATVLRQSSLFSALDEATIQQIAARAESWHYNRNDVIIWQGDQNDRLFIVKTGILGVLRLSADGPRVVAYLRPYEAFGETGALSDQSRPANATVTALSEVEVLAIRHHDFLDLLSHNAQVGLGLSRVLAQRLSATNERLQRSGTDTEIALVVGARRASGATTLGLALARTLYRTTSQPTVYAEFPHSAGLRQFVPAAETDLTSLPGGPDIYTPAAEPQLPNAARATLLMDLLTNRYRSVVIGLPDALDEGARYLLGYADQIIVVADENEGGTRLATQLRAHIRLDQAALFLVRNRFASGDTAPEDADFIIPHVPDLPAPADLCIAADLPAPLAEVAGALADRLGRTQQVSVFIPTTVDVDQAADAGAAVDQTLAFLGRLFGGATSSRAQGVWNSERAGLVNETIFVVRSYVTQADLDRHLPEVLAFVERLKGELRQEAMAVEVNQRLMLI